MEGIKVTRKDTVGETKNIVVSWNGNFYNVIYGRHENGGWFSIPNWHAGGELSGSFNDVFWNTESISRSRSLRSKKAAKAIAEAIAYAEKNLIIQ